MSKTKNSNGGSGLLQRMISKSDVSLVDNGENDIGLGERPTPLPFIGHWPVKTQYFAGRFVVVAFLLAAAGTGFYGAIQIGFANHRSTVASSVQTLTQKLVASSQSALVGDPEGVAKIKETTVNLSKQMNILLDGDTESMLTGLKNSNIAEIVSLERSARELISEANSIMEIAPALSSIDKAIITTTTATEAISQLIGEVSTIGIEGGASRAQIEATEQIKVLVERINARSVVLLQSKKPKVEDARQLVSDYAVLGDMVSALQKGDGALGINALSGKEVKLLMDQVGRYAKDLALVSTLAEKSGAAIVGKRGDHSKIAALADVAQSDAEKVSQLMSGVANAYRNLQYLAGLLLFGSIFGVLLIGLISNRATVIEGWDSRRKNKMNEQHIIDLMDEMEPLEDGDLTVRFTEDRDAMEGITGGIRSSVNEAVTSLRRAVETVKETAASVSVVVGNSVASTEELDVANKRQASEIVSIVSNVEGLTDAISNVTKQTTRAAEMTLQSKAASTEAAKVVSKTNSKMTESRVKMQEVLKSVKHQGETSHEIGQVVEAIESITDRTKVIAVNASLEASKAGAAGAGFQVLAGEVNRLAEQSNELLITITALVQRNQGETAATIKSVEDATNSVVEGAQLAESANEELRKISEISSDVAKFVDDIRDQSSEQSATAADVRKSMDRLSSLSAESQVAVNQVVKGVIQIDQSMGTLQKTVATFSTEKK